MPDYGLATLIAASCGSAFTAAAAAAAWRSVRLNLKESRDRIEPFVAVGIPRWDPPGERIVVPLKNLGLGPARIIVLQLLTNGVPWSVRIAPGLAPMESEEWSMYPANKAADSPRLDTLGIEGLAEDAAGRRHRLFPFGGGILLPFPGENAESGAEPAAEIISVAARFKRT